MKVVKYFCEFMNINSNVNFLSKKNSLIESKYLFLDPSKANKYLNWNNKYDLKKTLELTADWYKDFVLNKNKNKNRIIKKQINNFYFKK